MRPLGKRVRESRGCCGCGIEGEDPPVPRTSRTIPRRPPRAEGVLTRVESGPGAMVFRSAPPRAPERKASNRPDDRELRIRFGARCEGLGRVEKRVLCLLATGLRSVSSLPVAPRTMTLLGCRLRGRERMGRPREILREPHWHAPSRLWIHSVTSARPSSWTTLRASSGILMPGSFEPMRKVRIDSSG